MLLFVGFKGLVALKADGYELTILDRSKIRAQEPYNPFSALPLIAASMVLGSSLSLSFYMWN